MDQRARNLDAGGADLAAQQRRERDFNINLSDAQKIRVLAAHHIGNRNIVECQMRRGQHHETDIAADGHLAARNLLRLRLEFTAKPVPIHKSRAGERRHEKERNKTGEIGKEAIQKISLRPSASHVARSGHAQWFYARVSCLVSFT